MNDETKTFLVELFDVKLAENKKEIIKEITESFDQKFAEQNKLFDAKFDDLTLQVTQVVGEILDAVNNKFERERKKTDKKINKKIAML